MPSPWRDSTKWKRCVTISALVMACSLGLCGINFVVMTSAGRMSNGGPGGILVITAFIELGGIILSGISLLIALIGLMIVSLLRKPEENL